MITTTTPRAESGWNNHKDWGNCTGCTLHQYRCKPVLGRGTLPAPLLFVGEAPGPDENILGEPFVGPAGRLFDELIKATSRKCTPPKYAITNIVACFPQKSSQGDFREPTKEEAKACQQRLLEFIGLCRPKMVVTLGKIAEKYLPQLGATVQVSHLVHPSYIQRLGTGPDGRGGDANKYDLAFKRFVLDLEQIFRRTNVLVRGEAHV